jgi:hypothetical protein
LLLLSRVSALKPHANSCGTRRVGAVGYSQRHLPHWVRRSLWRSAEDFISGTAAQIADRTASKVLTFGSGPKQKETQHQPSTALGINARPVPGPEALLVSAHWWR